MTVEQPPSAAKRVGDAIRDARERAGQTPAAVAARAGIDPDVFAAIERGEAKVSLDALVEISSALDLSAAELVGRAEL